jgi:5-methylcytosine-specific restriction endonuclease McrA
MARPDYRSDEAARYRALYKSKAWRGKGGIRERVLARDPLCVRCQRRGQITPATVANHKRPHRGDLDLFFDANNCEGLCKPCHDGPTQSAERRGFSSEIGDDGWPVDPAHPSAL